MLRVKTGLEPFRSIPYTGEITIWQGGKAYSGLGSSSLGLDPRVPYPWKWVRFLLYHFYTIFLSGGTCGEEDISDASVL